MANNHPASPLIIAHRGASGYLPEHSLAAKALAHAMGADFLEQDVVLTRDGIPIVLHDIYLESTTDVRQQFPDRARADQRYYALDFSLQEIRQLRLHERSSLDDSGREQAVYPSRYPLQATPFQIPTLVEEIEFIAGLNSSRGCNAGFYIELKAPGWHLRQGWDIAAIVLGVLDDGGYAERCDQVYLQCFDNHTLKRLRHEFKTPLPLIQLLAENSWGEDSAADYDYLRTAAGLDEIATYADGIGPWIQQVYLGMDEAGEPRVDKLVSLARERDLLVHPYTFRSDHLPPGISEPRQLLDILLGKAGVDGLFTDFPDTVRDYLQRPA